MSINFTEKQKQHIERANEKEKIIQKLIQGQKLKDAIKGIKKEYSLCAETWSRLKKRYKESGLIGLIDHRGRPCGKNINSETVNYIKKEKETDPYIGVVKIKEKIKIDTGKEFTPRWIEKILKDLKLNNPIGRPPQETIEDKIKGQPIDHAGCWFLKGSDYDMMGTVTITKVVEAAREEYKKRNGVNKSFRTLVSFKETIQKKNETLLYLPVFGMNRPKDLERYHKSGLGIITGIGKRYRYSTIDKHQRELEKLNISLEVSKQLSRCYLEALIIKIELVDKSCFYIDGHMKTVWSDKNIPRGFRTAINKTEKSLEQIILTGGKGHPLILLTCPGDTHLTKEMFNLIDAFESGCGKEIVKITVFDREGVSIKIFQEFDRRIKCFITLLKENQHKGIKSFKIIKDFVDYKADDKTGKIKSKIADAEIELKDSEISKDKEKTDKENPAKYSVRVGLLEKEIDGQKKLIPIITNIKRGEEPDIKKIADRYFKRWPYEEDIIKDLVYGPGLNKNHGYKKIEVENRTLRRKKDELEQNIRGIEKRTKPVEEDIKKLRKEIEVIEKIYRDKIRTLNKEKNNIHYQILLNNGSDIKSERIKRLKQVENNLLDLTKSYEKHLYQLRGKLDNKVTYQKGLISQRDKKKEEINSLDMEQKLYEIVTEKDNLMSNYKLLLYNLSRYAREQWFSPKYANATFMMMRDKFYSQDGYIKLGSKEIKVTLNPYDDDELQENIEQACIKFNSSNILSPSGRRLKIYVEPQEKSGGNPDVTENLTF